MCVDLINMFVFHSAYLSHINYIWFEIVIDTACSGYAAEHHVGRRYNCISSSGAAVQGHCTALSSKCEQCHIDSWSRKLNADLLTVVLLICCWVVGQALAICYWCFSWICIERLYHSLWRDWYRCRYNDYTHDPLSACNCTPPYSGENAISARCDLNPANGTYPFDSLGHRSHGGTDAKVCFISIIWLVACTEIFVFSA